jgi:hypothetical protein
MKNTRICVSAKTQFGHKFLDMEYPKLFSAVNT